MAMAGRPRIPPSNPGAMVAGYEQTTRVNEPGRTLWTRLDVSF